MTSDDLDNLADELAHIAVPLLAADVAPLTPGQLIALGSRLKRECDVLRLMGRHYYRAEQFAPRLKRETEATSAD